MKSTDWFLSDIDEILPFIISVLWAKDIIINKKNLDPFPGKSKA